jgi:hypothetical protein
VGDRQPAPGRHFSLHGAHPPGQRIVNRALRLSLADICQPAHGGGERVPRGACPLWVRLRSDRQSASCPLSPWQRTPLRAQMKSASCHEPTFHRRSLQAQLIPSVPRLLDAPTGHMSCPWTLSPALRPV